jgi:hypothetical protein
MPATNAEELTAPYLVIDEFDQWPTSRGSVPGPTPGLTPANFVCSGCWCEPDHAAEWTE